MLHSLILKNYFRTDPTMTAWLCLLLFPVPERDAVHDAWLYSECCNLLCLPDLPTV